MTRSSGNVFVDAGFPPAEAARLLIRSELMFLLTDLIKKRRLTQKQAAKVLGVTQPRVSDLMRGRFELFSIDMLIEMLASLGVTLRFTATTRSRVA